MAARHSRWEETTRSDRDSLIVALKVSGKSPLEQVAHTAATYAYSEHQRERPIPPSDILCSGPAGERFRSVIESLQGSIHGGVFALPGEAVPVPTCPRLTSADHHRYREELVHAPSAGCLETLVLLGLYILP